MPLFLTINITFKTSCGYVTKIMYRYLQMNTGTSLAGVIIFRQHDINLMLFVIYQEKEEMFGCTYAQVFMLSKSQ